MAIGTTAAILGSAALGAAGSAYAAKKAAKSARRGAELTAAGEERALEYLQEREALPIALRDAALAGIGEQYGITLDEEGNVIREDMDLIERAKMDPLYQAELEAGEQAIARAATATGRLRGGATPADLARSGQEALGRSYGRQQSGLAGLAGMPLNTQAIAQRMGNIGQIYGQGQIAQGQIQQQGIQGISQALGTGVGQYLKYGV